MTFDFSKISVDDFHLLARLGPWGRFLIGPSILNMLSQDFLELSPTVNMIALVTVITSSFFAIDLEVLRCQIFLAAAGAILLVLFLTACVLVFFFSEILPINSPMALLIFRV